MASLFGYELWMDSISLSRYAASDESTSLRNEDRSSRSTNEPAGGEAGESSSETSSSAAGSDLLPPPPVWIEIERAGSDVEEEMSESGGITILSSVPSSQVSYSTMPLVATRFPSVVSPTLLQQQQTMDQSTLLSLTTTESMYIDQFGLDSDSVLSFNPLTLSSSLEGISLLDVQDPHSSSSVQEEAPAKDGQWFARLSEADWDKIKDEAMQILSALNMNEADLARLIQQEEALFWQESSEKRLERVRRRDWAKRMLLFGEAMVLMASIGVIRFSGRS